MDKGPVWEASRKRKPNSANLPCLQSSTSTKPPDSLLPQPAQQGHSPKQHRWKSNSRWGHKASKLNICHIPGPQATISGGARLSFRISPSLLSCLSAMPLEVSDSCLALCGYELLPWCSNCKRRSLGMSLHIEDLLSSTTDVAIGNWKQTNVLGKRLGSLTFRDFAFSNSRAQTQTRHVI